MSRPRSRRRSLGLAALAALLACAASAFEALAQQATLPARGRFLVATRQVQDPLFGRSVVLLFHAGNGATGLIVNRRTERRLAELLPDNPAVLGRNDFVYMGGPVEALALMALLRGGTAGEEAVFDDVRVAVRREEVEAALAEGLPPGRIRFFAGHAGWAPGQLENEIERGDWLVVDARAEQVFAEDPAEVWPELLRRHEGIRVEAPAGSGAPLALGTAP